MNVTTGKTINVTFSEAEARTITDALYANDNKDLANLADQINTALGDYDPVDQCSKKRATLKTGECPQCGKTFSQRGLNVHIARKHPDAS